MVGGLVSSWSHEKLNSKQRILQARKQELTRKLNLAASLVNSNDLNLFFALSLLSISSFSFVLFAWPGPHTASYFAITVLLSMLGCAWLALTYVDAKEMQQELKEKRMGCLLKEKQQVSLALAVLQRDRALSMQLGSLLGFDTVLGVLHVTAIDLAKAICFSELVQQVELETEIVASGNISAKNSKNKIKNIIFSKAAKRRRSLRFIGSRNRKYYQ